MDNTSRCNLVGCEHRTNCAAYAQLPFSCTYNDSIELGSCVLNSAGLFLCSLCSVFFVCIRVHFCLQHSVYFCVSLKARFHFRSGQTETVSTAFHCFAVNWILDRCIYTYTCIYTIEHRYKAQSINRSLICIGQICGTYAMRNCVDDVLKIWYVRMVTTRLCCHAYVCVFTCERW